MRLSQSDVAAHIAKNGAGWVAKYARYGDTDPYSPWLVKTKNPQTGKDAIVLYKAFTPPSQDNLYQLIEQQLGKKAPQGDDIMLDIITTQHVDRYKDENVIAGGNSDTYNGVVMDTHDLSEVGNILAHNIGLYAITLSDGVPAWIGASQFPNDDPINKTILGRAKRGFIPSRSIGMFVNRYEIDQDTEIQKLLEWSMYEYSYCAVPVNPYCTAGKSMLLEAEEKSLADSIRAGVVHEDDEYVHLFNGTAKVKHFVPKEIRSAEPKPKDFNSDEQDLLLSILLTLSDTTMNDLQTKIKAAFPNATKEQTDLLQNLVKGEGMSDAHKAKLSEAISHAEDAKECARKAMMAHKEAEGHMDAFHKAVKKCHNALKAIKGEAGDSKPDKDGDGDGDEKSLSQQIAEQVAGKSMELELADMKKQNAEILKRLSEMNGGIKVQSLK